MSYKVKEFFGALPYDIIAVVSVLSSLGLLMLYDAGLQDFRPWVLPQLAHFFFGFSLMLAIAAIKIDWILKSSSFVYISCLGLLILVSVVGHVGKGGQRWLDLPLIRLQPSELMRISLVVSLACYFHHRSCEEISSFKTLIPPLLLVLIPTVLVIRQPDLATAILIFSSTGITFFAIGVKRAYFFWGIGLFAVLIPLLWPFLHDYQKNRVLTFFNPERDPWGSGYHILQSKIALGSGGLFGKGLFQGTQSHLNFLPEKQTDFVFTMFCEEFGFVGALVVIILYSFLILRCFSMALKAHNTFSKLISVGVGGSLFTYVFINMAMVMGIAPIAGIPLPFISYGGSSMVIFFISFGLLINACIHKERRLKRM